MLVMTCAKFGEKRICTFRDNPLNPKLLNLENRYMIRILGIGLMLVILVKIFVKLGQKWINTFRDNPLNPKLLNLEN